MKHNLGLTKRQISQAKFRKEGICINGEKRRVSYVGRPGDVLTVCLEETGTRSGKSVPQEGELIEPDVEIELDDYRSYNRSKRSGLKTSK